MPVAIGIISFAIGLSLCFKDFTRVFSNPKGILVGLTSQIIVLPLVAFAIIVFWPIKDVYKLGFMLVAICPGGSMSNFLTYILKGRVALSVSLTAINSLIILFTIPLLLSVSGAIFDGGIGAVEISFRDTFGKIFYSVIVPTLVGVASHELLPGKLTEKIIAYLRYVVIGLLLALVLFVLFTGEGASPQKILENIHLIFPLLILNAAGMLAGYKLGALKSINLNHESRFTIAIETGLQNSVLAIFIATELLKKQEMALMPILYGGFSLFTSWMLAYVLKRFFKPLEKHKQNQN